MAALRQGDIYWFHLGEPSGSDPAYLRPVVVVQSDLFNRSRIGTVVVASLTTNLTRAASPGNVLLDEAEAGLPRRSVVNVAQLWSVDRAQLVDLVGTLSAARVRQILAGLYLLLQPRDMD